MKATKLSWIAALTLGGLIIATPISRAQEKPDGDAKPKPERRERPERPAARAGGRVNAIVAELNLSDDQKDKLKTILKDEGDKLRLLREDTNLSQEDRRAKLREARQGTVGKVKELLNAEQFEKWQKARQAGGPRRAGGGPAGPGGPRPPKDAEKKPAN